MAIGAKLESEYAVRCEILTDLGPVTERLLQELLRAKELRVHSVRHRVKSLSSLQRKIGRDDASYEGLGEVHDLLGIRVITFFPDEVDAVAEVIEDEFEIDRDNSVDKRELLDPDRFGYLSTHYVASLSHERAQLTEFERFGESCFEIQVRSILQHAWAEIEHDLGYQSSAAIPNSMRRRFSRLAGVLEMADDEFQSLRNDATEYQETVEDEVDRDPDSVTIDQDSIHALISSSKETEELDREVAVALRRPFKAESNRSGSLAKDLQQAGFQTIGEVTEALRARRHAIVGFAVIWVAYLDQRPGLVVSRGISLFYLAYLVVTDGTSSDRVTTYLTAAGIGEPSEAGEIAENLLKARRELDGES